MTTKEWCPGKFLNAQTEEIIENFAIVILNRPISLEPQLITRLWNSGIFIETKKKKTKINFFFLASVRLLVDGGAIRWLSYLNSLSAPLSPITNPELLTGDFDSISTEAINHFRELGTQIITTPDQDATDFTKALKELKPFVKEMNVRTYIIL